MPGGDKFQVVYVDGDVPQLPIQLGQLLVDQSLISVGTTNLQQCTSQDPLVYEPLQGGYPITPEEVAAGVTVVNTNYPPLTIDRYGNNTVPGTTDMRVAAQAAVDVAYEGGGGTVLALPGRTYRLTNNASTLDGNTYCLVIRPNVTVEMQAATFSCEVGTGNQIAVWLRGDNTHIRGGTVNAVSSGSPSSQAFYHAAISIGVQNNSGDTVASPSIAQFMSGWSVRKMTLSTTRLRQPVLQGMGGLSGGVIDEITIPTSSTHSGIHFDWGNVGTVSSAAIPTTKTAFLANQCYTTHPHNIDIRNITVGTLSAAVSGDVGTFAVRLSACYGIEVNNLEVESVTYAAYLHTGGDLGFEFAPTNVKLQACKGNYLENWTLLAASSDCLQGAFIDTLADNVYREQFLSGYVPLMNPLMHGDVRLTDCRLMGADMDNTYGVRIIQARGVKVLDSQFSLWKHGIFVDEFTQDIDILGNVCWGNRNEGIKIGFAQLREGTERVLVAHNSAYSNGTSAAGADIRLTRGKSIWFEDNTVGVASTTQTYGIRVDDVSCLRDIRMLGNLCLGAVTSAFSYGAAAPAGALMYKALSSCQGNVVADGVAPASGFFAEPTYIPYTTAVAGTKRLTRYYNPSTSAPTDGTWYRNDVLDSMVAAAAGNPAHEVTTPGTFGTLASITNGSTTNGSKDFTCSLTGITVTMSQAAYSCVVSSAAGLRAGMKCSIAGAGITNAEILSVSGTTLQLDTQANAAVAGGAFSTTGLVEGEVVSLNTTTPIAGAVVLKTNGTTVTLDTAASDTQSGRTVSYTTPVFKTFAAIAA